VVNEDFCVPDFENKREALRPLSLKVKEMTPIIFKYFNLNHEL